MRRDPIWTKHNTTLLLQGMNAQLGLENIAKGMGLKKSQVKNKVNELRRKGAQLPRQPSKTTPVFSHRDKLYKILRHHMDTIISDEVMICFMWGDDADKHPLSAMSTLASAINVIRRRMLRNREPYRIVRSRYPTGYMMIHQPKTIDYEDIFDEDGEYIDLLKEIT